MHSVTFLKIEVTNLYLNDTRAISFLCFLIKQFGICLAEGLGRPIRAACVVDCRQLWELRNSGNGELPPP